MARFMTRHMRIFQQLKGMRVDVGWFEDTYPSGKLVREVMRINEYGAAYTKQTASGPVLIVIPARPFMRLAKQKYNENRKEIEKKINPRLMKGEITPEQAMQEIGEIIKGLIEESILYGGWTPNAASTVKRKGFDLPLVETSQAVDTIKVKVS